MVINPIAGVYIPIMTIPTKGEMTIPNIGSLDPGTYVTCFTPPPSKINIPLKRDYISIGKTSSNHHFFKGVLLLVEIWKLIHRPHQTFKIEVLTYISCM